MNGGLMAYERMPRDEAAEMVRRATEERHKRRGYEDGGEVSELEIDLVAALLYIGASGFDLQVPLGPYDADILFPDAGLLVEVDGRKFHDVKKDWARDRYIRKHFNAYTLRLEGRLVWRDPIMCAKRVAAEVGHQRGLHRKSVA